MKNKIIAIHQPEHFPYMGFFQKMSACDLFVILDDVQFEKDGFQNRNKIVIEGREEWITVPVEKNSDSKIIKDVNIAKCNPGKQGVWQRKIIQKIMRAYQVDVTEIYSHNSLIDINLAAIDLMRNYFGITTPMIRSSMLDYTGKKSKLVANIVRAVGGTHYLSGQGGKNYIDLTDFEGIQVDFFEPKVSHYYSCLHEMNRSV